MNARAAVATSQQEAIRDVARSHCCPDCTHCQRGLYRSCSACTVLRSRNNRSTPLPLDPTFSH
ncbi:hypothetical protein J6590_068477 [Homalodisca vitripennis]|nr:hypothetical protein J6590_068477 [Homalodisca vitripennis]